MPREEYRTEEERTNHEEELRDECFNRMRNQGERNNCDRREVEV